MPNLRRGQFRLVDIGTLALSAAVLLVCIYYLRAQSQMPWLGGLALDPQDWTVLTAPECEAERADCLEAGDQILSLGGLSQQEYRLNWGAYLYRGLQMDGSLEVYAERAGEPMRVVLVQEAGATWSPSWTSWAFTLVFWLVGTGVILLVRPRNTSWLLLLLLCLSTAVWLAAGTISYFHFGWSGHVYHAIIWFFLPFLVHTHLMVPYPILPKLRRWFLPVLYLAACVVLVLDFQHLLSQRISMVWVGIAGFLTLAVLIYRLLRRSDPTARMADRILFFGLAVGLLPLIVVALLPTLSTHSEVRQLLSWLSTFMLAAILPIWPLSYLYALSKYSPGPIELRANRLLSTYGFQCLLVTSYLGVYSILESWIWRPPNQQALALVLALVFIIVSPPLNRRFQKFIDRVVYGIQYLPEEITGVFAARIPTAFDLPRLRQILLDEVLPTLMIRESALYVWDADGRIDEVYRDGKTLAGESAPPPALPEASLAAWLTVDEPTESDGLRSGLGWVRLAVPLHGREQSMGVWLLGRRDPDDLYPNPDVELLHNIANQIAPVLENMRLVERAREEVAENRRLQQQLIQSQKMEAIGRLSAGVAHDFNNLLSVILGYCSLLSAKYRGDETLGGYLSDIRDAGDRAAALTRQLLAFSRQQVMEAQVVDLDEVLDDVEKMLSRLAGEDIVLVTELAGNLPRVRIDPAQMGQVVMNLAVNARDAMPEGGRFELRTEFVELEEELEDRVQGVIPPGAYVLLTVSDDGEGIAEDQLVRIFEPYFTTKEMGKGTGLGLSMVYGIITQFKGYIRVSSVEAEGTVFSIYLPALTTDESKTDVRSPLGVTEGAGGTESILVVEDEESVRHVACEILESHGYQVHSAADGATALELFDRLGGRFFDAVLTDVVMPEMKGTELAAQLRQRQEDLVIVFMSGYNEESVFSGWRGDELDRPVLIPKPFSPAKLVAQMRRLLDRAKTARAEVL